MSVQRLFKKQVQLMVCDIQDKFTPLVYGKEGVLQASSMMVRAANVFDIPIIVTEHLKKTFGETCPQIKQHLNENNATVVEKTKFSMLIPETEFALYKYPERKQIILVGMETQVYLKALNYEVFLPVDAITSLRKWQRSIALRRMENQGAILTSFESAVFDLMKDSKDEKFKQILKIIKETNRKNAIDHL